MNEMVIKYEVDCDKCNGKAVLVNFGKFGYLGRMMVRYRCKKCNKIVYRWI